MSDPQKKTSKSKALFFVFVFKWLVICLAHTEQTSSPDHGSELVPVSAMN